MDIETTLEWFYFADADFESAIILNDAYRKHNNIICYHCQQAVEKYLKAFLYHNDIMPPKIHVLETLCALCSDFDPSFNEIAKECAYLSPFAVHARYPFEVEISSLHTANALEIVQKIKCFPPIAGLKEKLLKEKNNSLNTGDADVTDIST